MPAIPAMQSFGATATVFAKATKTAFLPFIGCNCYSKFISQNIETPGIRSVQVVGRKSVTSAEHPEVWHLIAALHVGGSVH